MISEERKSELLKSLNEELDAELDLLEECTVGYLTMLWDVTEEESEWLHGLRPAFTAESS